MHRRTTRAVLPVALVAGLLAGCASTDRAGGPLADTTRLSMLTRTLGVGPGAAFADEVDRASNGSMTVAIESAAHRGEGRASDAAILDDVVRGDADLGVVSIEALQQAGIHSLDPFVAPGLLTSLDAEAAAAESPTAATMLEGASDAGVVGVAIVPGPIHHLASLGQPLTADELTGASFLVTATASPALDVVRRLGATAVLDDRVDPLDATVRALDVTPQMIGQREAEDAEGFLFGNVPLWPQPVVIVANPTVIARLSDPQRELVTQAGRRAARAQAETVAKETDDGLAALCRESNWAVVPADGSLVAMVDDALVAVSDQLGRAAAGAATVGELEQIARVASPAAPLACPGAPDASASARDTDAGRTADALHGTWAADVTQESLDAARVGPTEQGLVGHWELTISGDGRIAIVFPDLGRLDAALDVDGETMTISIDSGTGQQGRGEVWRFGWSVFRDSLTLTRVPGDGIQDGPTALVSQPFTRT